MKLEQSVARHYTHGSLEPAILEALKAAGKDLDRLALSDLAPVDEFHIGGRQATADLAAQVEFGAGLHLLDIGCGLGGASRISRFRARTRLSRDRDRPHRGIRSRG